MENDTKPQILILGGGYAGVATAVNMIRLGVDKTAGITLINESNFHYLTTLLHHAILEPVNEKAVSIYLPEFFKERINFIRAYVEHIEPFGKAVTIRIGQKTTELRYDYLIIALGWEPDYYNIQGLRENAFVLRNIESAHKIHDHIEEAFARYDKEPNQSWLVHILIGGASFTGIEIAAEVADLVPMLSK